MKLPFVRAVRNAFPRAHITWLAGTGRSAFAGKLAPLVDGLLDEVIENGGFDRPWTTMLTRPVGGRSFDLVIDTQRGVPVTLMLRRVRHRVFVSGTAGYLLSDIRPPRGRKKPRSLVRGMIGLLELVTGAPAEIQSRAPLAENYRTEAARLLPGGPVYIGLGATARGKHKLWPVENYVALAHRLLAKGMTPVFMLGPMEKDLVERLSRDVPDARFPSPEAHPAPGFTDSPVLTIALAERLTAAIANDSGTGHMIAAAETPMITLFGPTPAEKFAPLVAGHVAIEACSYGSDDMAAIPVDAVELALDALLSRTAD